ncbi:AzlC family ABC transporter permease [Enterobacillus tribolii]|uniref:4-azaleucine resistance transporter AzlC n=1 Tax=Enterobacillus tribolii TaxID=1487935 RepID=A0A370R3Z5_9GAMM|nr:AzlC family ABC transporter permease [Enterobacillus tribolii]MBW7984416.1 branched-chain amino acid ABC transporter permease [Enterobacillus tribolii]RDK97154.1 4-azaleucine resistance transporter AzlC [Enterobacillus tribolii]
MSQITDNAPNLSQLNHSLIWSGFRQLIPVSIFVAVFGAAFGLAASQKGLGQLPATMMSMLVFAGYAQFAALDLWADQVPLFTLIATVFAINARHLLMGATLYPWLRSLSPAKRYGIMMVVSDANWAMSIQAFSRGRPGLGLLFGGGLALWLFWITGTMAGLYFGSVVRDPKSYGLDMVMGCFLLSMVFEGERSLRMPIIWTVAAGASLMAYKWLPENSHVIAGALAGGIAGIIMREEK